MKNDIVQRLRDCIADPMWPDHAEVSKAALTKAADEIERLRAENTELKRDLRYAREGLTKGRTRMREDNERLAREAHTWSKAAETYTADAESLRAEVKALRELWDEAEAENANLRKALGPSVTMRPLDPLDVEEMWGRANADERADEVHHAFARLLERAHGIGA